MCVNVGRTCSVLRANSAHDIERVGCCCCGKSSDAAAHKRCGGTVGCCRPAFLHAGVVHVELNASVAHPQEHSG